MSRAPLRLIFPGRSDGTGEKPPPSKLQKTTEKGGIVRWLEHVSSDEAKSRDWRKKLGLMLVQELEIHTKGKPEAHKVEDGAIYMLHDFPEGYTLYEQHTIKPSSKVGGQAEERRDAYLYGHPGGEKKRFRTPKEFFEHLWWLMTDEKGDPNNCTCPRCVPEDLHKEVEEFVTGLPAETKSTKPKPTPQIQKNSPAPSQTVVSKVSSAPPVNIGNVGVTKSTPGVALAPAPAPTPTPTAGTANTNPRPQPTNPRPQPPRPMSSGRAAPKSHLAPSQPPEPRNVEQAEDMQLGGYLYRIGEIVWFEKGPAWGLGIIHERGRKVVASGQAVSYTVQPLSYPGANCERVQITSEAQLKPWYAYSPPNATHARLNQPDAVNRAFNEIPWPQVVNGGLGPGEAEVDASIYAAKTVDRSYCPIDKIRAEGNRSFYNGVFVGAEKIWRGDGVRLKNHATPGAPNAISPDILIITDIVENGLQPPAPDAPAPRESAFVIGDRYTWAQLPIKLPEGEANPQAYLQNRIPTRIPTLPDRVAEDLMKQNSLSVVRHQTASTWRLVSTRQQLPLSDVRGRWYESMRMLPIINEHLWRQALHAGQIPDVGRSLNARGDGGVMGEGSPGFRFSHREAVLGGSVPPSFRLPDLSPLNGKGGAGSGRGTPVTSARPNQQGSGMNQGFGTAFMG